jgi:hypothetical protein
LLAEDKYGPETAKLYRDYLFVYKNKLMSGAMVRSIFRQKVNHKFTFQNWRHGSKKILEDKVVMLGAPPSSHAHVQGGHGRYTALTSYGREKSEYIGAGVDVDIEQNYRTSISWHDFLGLETYKPETSSSTKQTRVDNPRKRARKQAEEDDKQQPLVHSYNHTVIVPQIVELPRGTISAFVYQMANIGLM